MKSPLGAVFLTNHARDRIERHAISKNYVQNLLDSSGKWRRSYDRICFQTRRDGVLWKLVLEKETRSDVGHDYDLVTVVPQHVDEETARLSNRWNDAELLNLRFYASNS